MSVMMATQINSLHDRTPGARRERYPVIGAVALDAMAAIAGPAGRPDYERAWSAAFDVVVGAMAAGGSDGARLAAA